MQRQNANIILNGDLNADDKSILLLQSGYIIAVDGGLRHLRRLERLPDILIGDLDSVKEADLEWCQTGGVRIEHYPREKDQTDFELALIHAIQAVDGSITIYGALGGRTDHILANISLLASPIVAGRDMRIENGSESLSMIHNHQIITGAVGDIISLLPWGGVCQGVTTRGLQYALRDETLYPESSRGISNLMISTQAEVICKKGSLLCVHQHGSA